MHRLRPYIFVIVFSSLALGAPLASSAMSSANFKISIDALDAGGAYSASANYINQDTVGETGTGVSSSTDYALEAGYQHMFETYISITTPSNLTMPPLGGISGGTSTSTLAWSVLTDDTAGYGLYIQSSTAPALRSAAGASFSDYAPTGSAPDFTWLIPSASSSFGFSPQGTDILQRYQNNGSTCNTGSSGTPFNCFDGLSTAQKEIAQSSASNEPNGATTTVDLEAQIGSAKIQDSGSYTATITVTAVAL